MKKFKDSIFPAVSNWYGANYGTSSEGTAGAGLFLLIIFILIIL